MHDAMKKALAAKHGKSFNISVSVGHDGIPSITVDGKQHVATDSDNAAEAAGVMPAGDLRMGDELQLLNKPKNDGKEKNPGMAPEVMDGGLSENSEDPDNATEDMEPGTSPSEEKSEMMAAMGGSNKHNSGSMTLNQRAKMHMSKMFKKK